MSVGTLHPQQTRVPQTMTARQRLATLAISWRYAGGKRDLRFDLLRGFAVLAMIINHIGGNSSWLYRLSGGNHFYTSAAEGFVFISGLVFGIVYASLIVRHGLAEGMIKALRRAGTLYALTVLLTFTSAALSYRLRLPWAPEVDASNLRDFILGVLTLHRTFYLTDVLLLYTLLLVGAALALVFFATGRTWMILAASWGVWALWQIDWRYANFMWYVEGNQVFHLAAWQVLFFTGLAFGYHRRTLAQRFGWFTGPRTLAISSLLFGGLLALYHFGLSSVPFGHIAQVDDAFNYKPNVGIGRIVAFAIVVTFFLNLLTNLWQPLLRATGWLLLPLGQHALFAYGAHLFVIMATTRYSPYLFGTDPSAAQNALVQALGVIAIWAALAVKPRVTAWLQRLPLPQPQRVCPNARTAKA